MIPEHDMYGTFNMGIGMTVAIAPESAEKAITILAENDVKAFVIGEIVEGTELSIV
jgi:phosphoribosylformylglycinamidine cyclo-ligase